MKGGRYEALVENRVDNRHKGMPNSPRKEEKRN